MVRRGLLLLVSGLAAVALVPHAAADPTATTPAPDPNPPPGAVPDPYSPPPKTTAKPVYSPPRVYTPPAASAPEHVSSGGSSAPTYTPRPAARHARVTVKHHARKARPVHHHRRVAHHEPKHVVVRLTPQLDSYIALVGKTVSATIAPAGDGAVLRRRRAAGIALVVLCLASTSLILLGRRRVRERMS